MGEKIFFYSTKFQSNRLQVMHCAHKAKKIEMANRRAMLMENVRRTSERVMEARKSADVNFLFFNISTANK